MNRTLVNEYEAIKDALVSINETYEMIRLESDEDLLALYEEEYLSLATIFEQKVMILQPCSIGCIPATLNVRISKLK